MRTTPFAILGLSLTLLAGTGCALSAEPDDSLGEAALAAHTANDWSVVISTPPGVPQDVWMEGKGNDVDGWLSGGNVCLGILSSDQGPNDPTPAFSPGDHATLKTTVVAGGLLGVDGTPVPPGNYYAPGNAADQSPGRAFTLTAGSSYYLAFDGYVQNTSNPAAFPFPKGSTIRFMFTFDYLGQGRQITPFVLWVGVPTGNGYSYFPFLNEGDLMANVRKI
jgi:hypothetical protein